jgi:hypothetical protein
MAAAEDITALCSFYVRTLDFNQASGLGPRLGTCEPATLEIQTGATAPKPEA